MYLKSIELSGFKSFAKKSQLDFNSSITAIVGPNGSGKSNVTEAFRFVLGEQSMKSLRSRRGEDLIWNGSPELSRSGRASVKIIFDNRKKIINVDFDEVSIERVVFQDGTNEYYLNGSQVRLKDILELLSPTNIGPSGHHIISQGEADKILNAGSRERREMIEDALGLRLFQYKKQESRRKLEKTEENIKQAESLRRELLPHIRFLKKQFEKLQKTKEMRGELLKLYLEFFSAEKRYLDKERQRIMKERIEPVARLSALRKELEKTTASLKTGIPDEKKGRLLEIEEKLRNLREEKELLSRNIGRLEGQELSLREVWENEKRALKEDQPVSRIQIENLRSEASGFLEDIEKSQDIDLVKKLFRKLVAGISDILSRSDEEKASQNRHETLIKNLEKEKSLLESKRLEIEKSEAEQSELFKKLREEIEKEKDVNRDLEKSVFRMKAEESELSALVFRLDENLSRLDHSEYDFEKELKEARVLSGEAVLKYSETAVEMSDEEREIKRRQIEKIKIRLEDSGGIGEEVEREFREVSERDLFLEKELADLEKSNAALKQLIKDLEIQLDQNFKKGIEKINERFQDLFALMFNGGNARLSVVKEQKKRRMIYDDLLDEGGETGEIIAEQEEQEEQEEGLEIKVSLPRKKIKGLQMLSGGERALTSIALIFAVSQVNPPPFLVLDETDAALDEANSRRYGDMIEALSKHSQLILITHNRETMSRAGVLYGITMGKEGYSKILSVAFDEAVSVAK